MQGLAHLAKFDCVEGRFQEEGASPQRYDCVSEWPQRGGEGCEGGRRSVIELCQKCSKEVFSNFAFADMRLNSIEK